MGLLVSYTCIILIILMKKLLASAFALILLLSACTPVQEVPVAETENEMVWLDNACLTASQLENFTEENVLEAFSDLADYKKETIAKLFAEDGFIKLKAQGEYFSLCAQDSLSFVMYGNYGEYNNVIGRYESGSLVTNYQYNRGMGDIGVCSIVGEFNGLFYICGGGDGPASFYKLYRMDTEGKTTTIEDCEYSSENSDVSVGTCTTDLLNVLEN